MTPDERWLKAHHIEPCQIEEPVRQEDQAALIAVIQQAAANWCERAREEHLAMKGWRILAIMFIVAAAILAVKVIWR